MENKVCRICNIDLPINEFYIKDKERRTYGAKCRKCIYKSKIEYLNTYNSIPENKNRIRENSKRYKGKKALEKRLVKQKLKEEALLLLNIEKEKKRIENEKIEQMKKLAREEKDRINAYKKTDEYKIEQKNKDKVRRYNKWKNNWANDELFAIRHRLRTLVRNSFRKSGYSKFEMRTEEIVGINYEEFKQYMESKFQDGMSWGNRGDWHIDHIIPLASAKSEEELIALSHYTNLQPLWAMDNLKKGSKIIYTEEELMQQLNKCSNVISEHKTQKTLRPPQANVRGYFYHKRDKKYIVRICLDRKKISIGRFDTPEEASEAYQKARLLYFV